MSAQVVPQQTLVSVTDGDERGRRKYKAKQKKRRKDIEEAFDALMSHPEPSVVAEAREIARPALEAGELVIERLPDFRAMQLMALYREIEEEEELLLLLS